MEAVKGLLQGLLGEQASNQIMNGFVTSMGGPAVQALYDKLGTSEQNMMTEMLTGDSTFRATLEGLAGRFNAGEGGQDIFASLGSGALNSVVRNLYANPQDRTQTVQTLAGLFGGAETPAGPAATPDAAPTAVTPSAENSLFGGFFQQIMGNQQVQQMISGFMNSPFGQFVGAILQQVLGISLDGIVRSTEVMTQSSDPSGVSRPGQTVLNLLDPTALVHQVSPENEVTTRTAAELTGDMMDPTPMGPEQRFQPTTPDMGQTPGFTPR